MMMIIMITIIIKLMNINTKLIFQPIPDQSRYIIKLKDYILDLVWSLYFLNILFDVS